MDSKFTEFENAAIQREKDYKNIIEQQRLDSEQLKGFEKLKEANLELRAVRKKKIFEHFYQLYNNTKSSHLIDFAENSKDSRELSTHRQPIEDTNKAFNIFWQRESIADYKSIRAQSQNHFEATQLVRHCSLTLILCTWKNY